MPADRVRREPPPLRRVEVRGTEQLTPRMARVTLTGSQLEGLRIDQPAASVRLLLPPEGETDLVMPEWNGNEFLLPDGRRPTIRTLTPRHLRSEGAAGPELDLDVVLHDGGVLSAWAESVEPGAVAAVSGPGRGYEIDEGAPAFLLAGDETAIPAICQLLEVLPRTATIHVIVEVARPDARLDLHEPAGATARWVDLPDGAAHGDALVAAVTETELADSTAVWAAGEAAAVQRIRKQLFEQRGLSRKQATVRGYWKHGRAGD